MFNTPILFLIFNRPDTTKQVFLKIKELKPKQLFVAADGAREHKDGEQELVEQTRRIVLDNIDWECEVKTLLRNRNLGCGKAVSEAITWFFEQVEQGIILEDDCLPEMSFFYFCEKMLEKYKYNQKILMITGTNYLFSLQKKQNIDYYYSNICAIWGWATWRRAWELCDSKIRGVDRKHIKTKYINQYFTNFIYNMIKDTVEGNLDTWDTFWLYNFIIYDGLSVTPIKNQIKNIGYSGTHTNNNISPFINMPTEVITNIENLKSPNKISPDSYLDKIAIRNIITKEHKPKISLYQKIKIILINQKLRIKNYVLKFSKKD